MRVDVFVNKNAGRAALLKVEEKIADALFRCDLTFQNPGTITDMETSLRRTLQNNEKRPEAIIICGGDGTINHFLGPLMKLRREGRELPTISLIPIGTANDLANELGVSRRIERSARAILEGDVKYIDVIEITSGQETKYMMTNGGLGVPAKTAQKANALREWVKKNIAVRDPIWGPVVDHLVQRLLAAIGTRIYEVLFIGDVVRWQAKDYEVQISIPGIDKFVTSAPFIMINNQPSIGGNFTTAPFTSNADGTFNVMMVQAKNLLSETKAILDIRMGRIPSLGVCPSFETSSLKLAATNPLSNLTFFGDGEVLFENVAQLNLLCMHPGLPVAAFDLSTEEVWT